MDPIAETDPTSQPEHQVRHRPLDAAEQRAVAEALRAGKLRRVSAEDARQPTYSAKRWAYSGRGA